MERERDLDPSMHGQGCPRLILPAYEPPTEEELERRQNAAREILRIRDEIGPIGRSVTDLIREDRNGH